MKHIIIIAMLLVFTPFLTLEVNAAKENFERSKPHMAELAKIEKACKTNQKQCAALKKAYKKKYNKEPNLTDYNSSRSNNSSSDIYVASLISPEVANCLNFSIFNRN